MKKLIIKCPLLPCAVSGVLLFMAAPVFAQDVQINEKTMRDAWIEDEPQFESLSNDMDTYERDSYFDNDYSKDDRDNTQPSPADDSSDERHRERDYDTDWYERRQAPANQSPAP